MDKNIREHYHHGDLKNALVQAGIVILAEEGLAGLSLRKVARQAGVSHTAPYAHFADKQALIASIATHGYQLIYEEIQAYAAAYPADPLKQLVGSAWAYLRFAHARPAHFKLTYSGVIEREGDYPALVEMAHKTLGAVKDIVEACQVHQVLPPGSADLMTVVLWSQVHGLASLTLAGQISNTIRERFSLKALLATCLQPVVLVEMDQCLLDELDAIYEPIPGLPTTSA